MNKAEAIHAFLNSFGVPAYPVAAVPLEAEMPYIDYTLVDAGFLENEQNLPLNIWFKTDSEKEPNDLVEKLAKGITLGGTTLKCDSGLIWLKKGSPWSQVVAETDNTIKRRLVNITVEYLTEY